MTPLLGRGFRPEDGVKGHENVAILTYPLWQSLFHGDPGVIGKAVRLGDTPREVIGVLPADFHFPNRNALPSFRSKQSASSVPEPAVFLPAVIDLSETSWNGDYGNWLALARLKPGVSIKQAEAQLTSIEAQVWEEMPANERDDRPGALRATVEPMQAVVAGDSRTGLWLLMAAVAGLMLMACVNLANAQLGRTLSRHREAALRSALGAPKWRLVWNSLAENLLLAAVGGRQGAARRRGIESLSPLLPGRPSAFDGSSCQPDGAALFGGPNLRLERAVRCFAGSETLTHDPQAALQQSGSRTLGSRQGHRLRAWLIGLQVFGCTVLLLVTGLFSKSLLYLLHQDKGFETGHVAIAEADLPRNTYGADPSRTAFDDAVLRNLRAIPGVQSAGLVSAMPLEGESWIEDLYRVDRPNQDAPLLNLRWVGPGYFETMRERLVAGRFFEERDRNLSSAVLSESEAKALWHDENPIGGQVQTEGRKFTVIGVVADSHNYFAQIASRQDGVFALPGPATLRHVLCGARHAVGGCAGVKHAPSDLEVRSGCHHRARQSPGLAIERFTRDRALSDLGSDVIWNCRSAARDARYLWRFELFDSHPQTGNRRAHGAWRNPPKDIRPHFGRGGVPVIAGLGAGLLASTLAGRVIQKLLYGVQVCGRIGDPDRGHAVPERGCHRGIVAGAARRNRRSHGGPALRMNLAIHSLRKASSGSTRVARRAGK